MDPNRRLNNLLVLMLFVLAGILLPLHLTNEDHIWETGHHDQEHDTDSTHDPHPAADHQVGAATLPKVATFEWVEVAILEGISNPELVHRWVAIVSTAALDPPEPTIISILPARGPPLS